MLSLIEIDKYVDMSIKDFLPSNTHEAFVQFDDLGIMKQVRIELNAKRKILHFNAKYR